MWTTFKKCIGLEEIASKSGICLDVPTRWNSTYLMLEGALKFRKAFERLEEEDSGFLSSVGDDDVDDDKIGDIVNRRISKKLGPPNNNDWEKVKLFVRIILDPRYKMRYFDFALECMYANDPTKAVDLSLKVKNALTRMYEAYNDNDGGNNSDLQQQRTSPPHEEVNSTDGSGSGRVDRTAERMAIFKQRLQSENTLGSKNEVDRYLAESCEEAFPSFDILIWWRNWLRSSSIPINLKTLMNEVEDFKRQLELVRDGDNSMEASNTMSTTNNTVKTEKYAKPKDVGSYGL
ncbi:hypothetical protein F2P56_014465 [Juglans regia]|uniref:Zinc finger BED domain-containing protein RICESLEEPER 2-like n=1 Tax=Juglans regia TaxID=51240 RepID=A0A833XD79_JUGRE|nr:hypothetical protein F2P56_014465 [Juglans regia]